MNDLPQKNRFPKLLRVFIWIVGLIAIIAVTGAIYVNYKWKPLLRVGLQTAISEATDSLYRIDYKDVRINVLSGNIVFDSLEIKPNNDIYERMILERRAPENLIDLVIQNFIIEKIRPIKVYKERKLHIRDINIQQPSLTVFYRKLGRYKNKKVDERSAYQVIKKILKEIRISSIFLTNIDFKYVDMAKSTPRTTHINQMNLRLNDILIDSTAKADTSRLLYTKDIIAEINNYLYATPDSMYHLNIKHAYISTLKKQFVAQDVHLIPRYDEFSFSNKFDKQTERYQLKLNQISVKNLDILELIDFRNIQANSINLSKGQVKIFLNRSKPAKLLDKGLNFPHLAIQRSAWGINTKKVNFKGIDIRYKEYNPQTKGEATIRLDNLRGQLSNLTNDSAQLIRNNKAKAFLQADFMGKVPLNIQFIFVLNDPKGSFSYKGGLGKMEMPMVNNVTKPLAMVTISSGTLQSLSFDINGNLSGAGGTLAMRYNDLKVTLMKKDEDERIKKMGLVSLMANALLLNNNNPKKNEPLFVSRPYYKRPQQASFFNLVWKTIFTGIKESIGITQEKEAKLLERAAKKKFAKAKREQRKLERKKKRNEKQLENKN